MATEDEKIQKIMDGRELVPACHEVYVRVTVRFDEQDMMDDDEPIYGQFEAPAAYNFYWREDALNSWVLEVLDDLGFIVPIAPPEALVPPPIQGRGIHIPPT